MRIIILAGGLGTRISEETSDKPKPMVLLDDKPILWHLMNTFSVQGFNKFVIAVGYKGDAIKRWLLDLNQFSGDVEIDTLSKSVLHLSKTVDVDWKVAAIETGLTTQTGGRIKRCLQAFPGERVLVTYGDGLANVNVPQLLDFHKQQGRLATVTSVRPPARFGHIESNNGVVTNFGEKNQSDAGWINGGYFILEPEVVKYISDDSEPFETGALPKLVALGQLSSYEHKGFWQPMDTLREKQELVRLAGLKTPPWLKDIC